MKVRKEAWCDTTLPHVVILGGGFGGLYAAKALRTAPVRITLIDRKNHHLFQPLLYQVASAGLSPGDIAYPIRSVLRKQRNARVLLAEVTGIDLDAKCVGLTGKRVPFDYLIVATGATHAYFGHEEWREHAPGLKSIEDALEIRRRVLKAFEAAELEEDAQARQAWLTLTVVGAGPTGVELAGALSEIALTTMARDFRSIDSRDARVILIEGQDQVLPPYPEELSRMARHQLEALGVEVRTNTRVLDIQSDFVRTTDEVIATRTTLWAAGVAASPLGKSLGCALDSVGRVLVTPSLSVPGHDSVFVIGDLAAVPSGENFVPGVAAAAVQGARHVASIIVSDCEGKGEAPPKFRYRNRGELATIGRSAAVAQFGRLRMSGFTAWLVWWLLHIALLIGFRSKLFVMLGWIWSYLSFGRGARLITQTARATRSASSGLVAPGSQVDDIGGGGVQGFVDGIG